MIPYLDVILDMDDSHRVFRSAGFRSDATAVAAIPKAQLEALLASLDAEAEDGFTGRARLSRVVHEHVTERAQADAAQRFLLYFARNRRAKKLKDASEYVNSVQKDIVDALAEKNAESSVRAALEERLPHLLKPRAAIDRQLKADELLRRVGHRAMSIDMVCDLRPVFDEDRARIEGLIPLTTLKIVALRSGAVEPSVVTEVVLTESALSSLEEKLADVRKKLAAMKAYVSKTGVRVPDVRGAFTDDEDGDGDDA